MLETHIKGGQKTIAYKQLGLSMDIETKVAQHIKQDWFKVSPNIQDLWAKSRGKILHGLGQEQLLPQ